MNSTQMVNIKYVKFRYSLDVILTMRYSLESYFFHTRYNVIPRTISVNVSRHREVGLLRRLRAPNRFKFYVAIDISPISIIHNDISPSGEQPEQHKSAHTL